ncbi:MAG: hypothetical protein HZA51_16725 [Planctomycetes bacterium]|nr:hypothetical protein [Planctomycetota bacterium]
MRSAQTLATSILCTLSGACIQIAEVAVVHNGSSETIMVTSSESAKAVTIASGRAKEIVFDTATLDIETSDNRVWEFTELNQLGQTGKSVLEGDPVILELLRGVHKRKRNFFFSDGVMLYRLLPGQKRPSVDDTQPEGFPKRGLIKTPSQ